MKRIAAILASLFWTTSASAQADTQFPEYRAVVIYRTAQGAPEVHEVFGHFGSLEVCLVHAAARAAAI